VTDIKEQAESLRKQGLTPQEQILQNWANEFVDIYGKEPSQDTINYWKLQINALHWTDYDTEEDLDD